MESTPNPAEEPRFAPEPYAPTETANSTEPSGRTPGWWPTAAVFLAAVLGRLPALGAWWSQDDWGLLGRAAGLIEVEASGMPARILSQQWWWSLTWPLFHLDPTPHAWARLILHGLAAVMVLRIGRRSGLNALGATIAGLFFAATPLAFTPLYWAAGIQELLAGLFALVAIERWLVGGRRNLLLAVIASVFSILSKESGLALPIFFTMLLWTHAGVQLRDKAYAWALCLMLVLVAIVEGVVVLNHFGTAPGEPYATGGFTVVMANLGVFGYWLASFGPRFASQLGWGMAGIGLGFFALWAVWALLMWRSGSRIAAAAWFAALLSLGPALPLAGQIHPYLAYLAAAAFALTIGTLIPRRWPAGRPVLVLLTVVFIAWGFLGMRARLSHRDASGLPADPIARTTALSWETCRALPDLPLSRVQGGRSALTLLQMPIKLREVEMADRLGDSWVGGSHLYHALGGQIGPRLVLGDSVRVDWVNSLYSNPAGALVLCETGAGFNHWGSTANAALYAALTEIGLGHFERARKHIVRAADLGGETFSFAWDPEQMIIPFERSLERKIDFVDWTVSLLDNGEASGQEIGGLQDLYFNLLSTCTGQSVEEITSGSRLLLVDPNQDQNQGE